ncbi:hypothetical protein JW960_14250 [candidate division KSB1 bacterium]|nr:hypothetical protein [candidate division KSB1 bacterium]
MENKLVVRIVSFSYHQTGYPADASGNNGGFVFDCRFLPNPGREERYRNATGRDAEVVEYFSQHHEMALFLTNVFYIVDAAVTNYQNRGFSHLMIAFGCTGGQHRSVYSAENLAVHLRDQDVRVELEHIELKKKGYI